MTQIARGTLFIVLSALWMASPAIALERGTRAFIVEEGMFSTEELARIFAAYPERENTLYYGTHDGLEVSGPADTAAKTLGAPVQYDPESHAPSPQKFGHIAARIINNAAGYYRAKLWNTNSSKSAKADLSRIEFVILIAHLDYLEKGVTEAQTDACAWQDSEAGRIQLRSQRDLRLHIDDLKVHINTGNEKTVPRVLIRAVAISVGALGTTTALHVDLVRPGCPTVYTPIDLAPVDPTIPCPPRDDRQARVPASAQTSIALAQPICVDKADLTHAPSPSSGGAPSPAGGTSGVHVTQSPGGTQQPQVKPTAPATASPVSPAIQILPSAEVAIVEPDAGFSYRKTQSAPTSSFLIDVAISDSSNNSEAALWLAPAGQSGPPDPTRKIRTVSRWTVPANGRYRKGVAQHVFVVIKPKGHCWSGETLWARISVDGLWATSGDIGEHTVGGMIANCAKPALVSEVISVMQEAPP